MSLQSDILAAEQALSEAEKAAAEAKARCDDLKAKLDAATPHIGLWTEAKTWAAKWGADAEAEFDSFVSRARDMLGL